MSRVDRYLLREILVPFLFSVGFVVFVVFLFQLQRLAGAALGFGLRLSDVGVIFVSALPPFLVLAVPIAYLLSVLIGMGRLSTDLELVAMRSAGASPLRLSRVPIALGALVSLACLPIALHGEPLGLNLLYERLIDVGLRNITSAIQPGIFNEGFDGIALYAGGATRQGGLEDVLVYDDRDPARPVLIVAASGALEPHGSRQVVLSLDDGQIHLGTGSEGRRYDLVRFASAHMGIDSERELRERTRFVSELGRMSSADMKAKSDELGAASAFGRRIEKTYWRRYAFPVMALVFGVVGAAIALSAGPDARARNALLAVIAVVGYYVLTRVGDFLAVRYAGTPLIAAFGPNAFVLSLALVAAARAGRPR